VTWPRLCKNSIGNVAPIIPSINSDEIPAILKAAADAGALHAAYTIVRLNGDIGEIFRDWVHKNFPDRAEKVLHQIESVDKILADLDYRSIPQIIVLNKSDLVSREDIEILSRQMVLDKNAECVAISANARETLKPLVEHIAARIGTFNVKAAP